jgi:hypothetical protein
MAFDQATRNRLQRFVSEARALLTEEFTRQLQNDYGLDPSSDQVTPLESMTHLDNVRRETGRILRATLEHYRANSPSSSVKDVLERIVREQAFTILNRLAALRMAEARGFLIESIANGYNSRGFQLYARLAGTGLGETGDAYRCYLFSLFDEFALDLRVLFDRFSPMGRLFPREAALLDLLKLINDPEIAPLWAEDETIGWIYQYFNSKEERKKMRDESAAPRNSRELAVRNQFFTPRYVVEFLTDNTLGRIWYEMTQGETRLKDDCRYLVRRSTEIFLQPGEAVPQQSEIDDNLSQEELLKQPDYIPYRHLKDPREIRMLDPACGSMHFGLYAFDLYERIYEEVWDLEQQHGATAFQRSRELKPLSETYDSKEAFLRDVPRLIIRHNIHGIDIDPRAVQIAGLSLWLHAQKSWQLRGLKPQERPQIQRSNIVCAEPMPGEESLLNEFIEQHLSDTPEQQLVAQLVGRVFEAMKLAGEAGSLLQIEEEISKDIQIAKQQWLTRPKSEQLVLLTLETDQPKQQELPLAVGEITDEHFWERVEDEIYKALSRYAEQAENGGSYQRRLFANDAVRGFAFIDICRKKFDVALMNPPFGDASLPSKPYIEEVYGDTKGDVYKTFVECFQGRLVPCGMLGILSSRSGFFLGQSTDWRERVLLRLYRPLLLADLGSGVLDAMVETAAYVLQNLSEEEDQNLTLSILPTLKTIKLDKENAFSIPTYQKHRCGLKRHQASQELERLQKNGYVNLIRGHYIRFAVDYNKIKQANPPNPVFYPPFICLRLLAEQRKESTLVEILNNKPNPRYFVVSLESFKQIPSIPFAYWVSSNILNTFVTNKILESDGRVTRVTNSVGDDTRYFRVTWEAGLVSRQDQNIAWIPLQKGGHYSPYYADIHLLVDWDFSVESYRGFLGTKHRPLIKPASLEYFFRPGLTWSRRSQKGLSIRAMPQGCIFANKGPAVFVTEDNPQQLLALLAITNSAAFRLFVELQMAFGSYEVGVLQSTPVPDLTPESITTLATLARRAWSLKRSLDTVNQTSQAFTLPALLQVNGSSLSERAKAWTEQVTGIDLKLTQLQTQIDELVFDLYDIGKGDQTALSNSNSVSESATDASSDDDEDDSPNTADLPSLTSELLAYVLSVAFGRFDVRLATADRLQPAEPEPFAPLPVCSPGMLVDENGLPPTNPNELPSTYPVEIPFNGILVDNEGHPNDIINRVRDVLKVIWEEKDGDIEQEACEILKVGSLRDYFRKPATFFNDHLNRYSKSRRQAPIYLPLSTRSGSYTLWLYYHRLTDQTLYTCINDYVEPKLRDVREAASQLRAQESRSRKEDETLEALQTLEIELQEFHDKLLRIAQLPWKPNLNDGVQITVAPLWSLFRLSKWQKKLKETWEKLEKGDYDWAHLAYTMWTNRVREKCKRDKSLAIAHNLEHLYEEPPASPKRSSKRRRKADTADT